jgi:hypothetical protein
MLWLCYVGVAEKVFSWRQGTLNREQGTVLAICHPPILGFLGFKMHGFSGIPFKSLALFSSLSTSNL